MPAATSRRFAVLVFGIALYAGTSAVLASQPGGKAGAAWAFPFAALVCALPLVGFAATLSLAARRGLEAPRNAIAGACVVAGALVAALLFAVRPLVQLLGMGSNLIGGLMLSQLGMTAAAMLAAGVLASWRPPR
jgi:hypothetical protein